jgi:hypothetical protein
MPSRDRRYLESRSGASRTTPRCFAARHPRWRLCHRVSCRRHDDAGNSVVGDETRPALRGCASLYGDDDRQQWDAALALQSRRSDSPDHWQSPSCQFWIRAAASPRALILAFLEHRPCRDLLRRIHVRKPWAARVRGRRSIRTGATHCSFCTTERAHPSITAAHAKRSTRSTRVDRLPGPVPHCAREELVCCGSRRL